MNLNITLSNRRNTYFAEGVFDGKKVIVISGGKVFPVFSKCIRGGKKALSYRKNTEYVGKDGSILKDCIFTSPSTAAQFVTGRSVNGYNAWKVADKKTLGEYLVENGLR